jgi:hypothetical protein
LNSSKPKVLYLPRWYPNRYDPMPGLFIERHARSVSGHVSVAVLYIHQDEKLLSNMMEVDRIRDDELLQLKIYYRPFRYSIPVVKPLALSQVSLPGIELDKE